MYQIVGLPLLLRAFAWLVVGLATVVALATILMEVPAGLGWVKLILSAAGVAISIAMGVVAILANGRAFSWCCRRLQTFGVFPDLEGEWVGEIRSNWPRIAARGTENASDIALLSRPARATITANLFSVCMELATDDRYSTSRTFTSGISKNPATGEVAISYLYENTTLDPKPTDASTHYGAAKLTLRREGTDLVLEGPFWTNRAWHHGLNTAGTAMFRKPINSTP